MAKIKMCVCLFLTLCYFIHLFFLRFCAIVSIGVSESDLRESLGSIEEITGTLMVTNSFALTSLSFLAQLRQINGSSRHAKSAE